MSVLSVAAPSPVYRQAASRPWYRFLEATLNLAASVHVVWFYLSFVPSYMNLDLYEAGTGTTPFQHRMLLMMPLRWAHGSHWLHHLATWMATMPAWFPRGVRPEGLVEAPVDLVAVIITGLVARALYRSASRTGLLTHFVYPLTLLMVLLTYTVGITHRFRFVYDLPSLGLFAAGLYLLYFRKAWGWFAGLFVVATVNRETTLFLLVLYILREAVNDAGWRQTVLNIRLWCTTTFLWAFWVLWHVWVVRHFAANASEIAPRFWLNVGTLLWPFSWAHLLSVFAFCMPLVIAYRRRVRDILLRRWLWVLPCWLAVMFRYGLLVETRISGELIPYMACMSALIAEEGVLQRLYRYERSSTRVRFGNDLETTGR